MATLADKRAWLRNNTSEDIPARGRLRPDLLNLYDQAHPDAPDDDWDIADLDGDLANADDLEPSVPMQPERPPRTTRAARDQRRAQPATARASSLIGRLLLGEDKKKDAAKKKKPIPRTTLESFIARRYDDFGKLFAHLSVPTSRCIRSQAAFAGVVWEDIIRDTIVDKGLQPLVRAEDKLDKGFALVATPLAVFAVERNQVALQTGIITPGQFAVRQTITMSVLKEGLRKQIQIGRQYADQITAKLAEDMEIEGEVEKLLAFIFAPPEGATLEEPEMAGAAA